MTKEEFKAVEKKLYDYYQGEKIINSLKFKINLVEDQIKDIERKIAGNKVNITEDGLQAVNYSEKVQTTPTGASYAEQVIIREIDLLEKECIRKKEIKNRLEEKLRDVELDNSILEYNISFLAEADKRFLKEKYKNYNPDWKIAQILHKSRSAVNRIKSYLIQDIESWINLLN